jgi:hypothetical protein
VKDSIKGIVAVIITTMLPSCPYFSALIALDLVFIKLKELKERSETWILL